MDILKNLSNRHIPYWFAFILLWGAGSVYNIGIRQIPIIDSCQTSFVHAVFLITILFLSLQFDIAKLTIVYLALPYLIFFIGWLNTATALVMSCVFIFSTYKAITESQCDERKSLTTNNLLVFCLLITWVNLSGAGGYGYQSWDYVMHNSRLNDLIQFSWPVHYGKDLNLVYYVGYYLPSAMIGKLLGYNTASQSMFFSALLGVTLTMRWVSKLSGCKSGIILTLGVIFFGPMDIIGILWVIYNKLQLPADFTPLDIIPYLANDPDKLDFWAGDYLHLNIGNFLSNTFQLFWAPQHVIPGWLAICLMTHLFQTRNIKNVIFIFCLLCLWSPLVMISLSLFSASVIAFSNPFKNKEWITTSNIIGSSSLTILFLIFYFSGSASENFSLLTLSSNDVIERIDGLLLFYTLTFGFYASIIFFLNDSLSRTDKIWFSCLMLTMALLPMYVYGEYSDLLCRGAAPAMLLLMIYIFRYIRENYSINKPIKTIPLLILILSGSGSAILQMNTAITHYGEKRAVIQVTEYKHAQENLGGDNTFFANFFRKKIN